MAASTPTPRTDDEIDAYIKALPNSPEKAILIVLTTLRSVSRQHTAEIRRLSEASAQNAARAERALERLARVREALDADTE